MCGGDVDDFLPNLEVLVLAMIDDSMERAKRREQLGSRLGLALAGWSHCLT